MGQNSSSKEQLRIIRSKAEDAIKNGDYIKIEQGTEHSPDASLHELQVFQVELEMQIEELKRSQQELMAVKKSYAELYDFAPAGYITLNHNGLILNANLTFADMLSMERDSLINRYIFAHIPFEYSDIFTLHMRQLFNTSSKQVCELQMQKKDGTLFEVHVESTIVPEESRIPEKSQFSEKSGIPEASKTREASRNREASRSIEESRSTEESASTVQYRCIIIDISAQKAIEREKEQLQAELHRTKKMETVRNLTGGIAHDFNNILFIVVGNAELALDDIPESNPMHACIQEIKKAAFRAANIVKQLLKFSQKNPPKLKRIAVNPPAREAVRSIQAILPDTVEVVANIATDDIFILAEELHIQQVIINLCTNAYEAIERKRERGVVTVSVDTVSLSEDSEPVSSSILVLGNYVKITVMDTGSGIKPDIIDRIFEPYFTTKDFGSGAGIGLSVVHGIVKSFGGTVVVKSEPGQGSRFTLFFPELTEKVPVKMQKNEKIPEGTERILFVDDDIAIVTVLGMMLKRLGYTVESCLNPLEALVIFQKAPDKFDLVITDMSMPILDGLKFSEKIKEIRPDIPVIIATGHGPADKKTSERFGVDGYVMKPLTLSDIATVIRDVLK
ncbi:putative aerobic respiration control sensor protein ArcB [Desulfamplus magnetovallimortis]|uniref:histidine kinase n=1 Tax=Desulfamplus magnetovallimortis TaxID=1246637 RepID=A0A1W1HGY4_9BACT|nr:ATP-binding protein [Desulfamplus magnetovallimortis]SLM31642.1 putative aerobic respiration control sensor protein ArcB [Desulfamplus magnetovallimortis]